MWPFSKKLPPPADISRDGITARYETELEGWILKYDGFDFFLSGIHFDVSAFESAKEVAAVIRKLDGEIRTRLNVWLDEFLDDGANKASAHIFYVLLDYYVNSRTFEITYIGDDSWGDINASVNIYNGKIVDVYGGD